MSKYYCIGNLLLGIAFALSSCSEADTLETPYFQINKKAYQFFAKQDYDTIRTIKLFSGGGFPKDAAKIAKLFMGKDLTIVVDRECSSACANYLLPAAKSVIFKNEPIVGFHWSSQMNRDQMIRHGGDVSNCVYPGLKELEDMYRLKGLNLEFWKEVESRLVLESYQVVPKSNLCPWKKRKFENRMWLPTSNQLRSLLGLEFTGFVCADDFQACAQRANKRWPRGTRIVIGDEIYISNGSIPK